MYAKILKFSLYTIITSFNNTEKTSPQPLSKGESGLYRLRISQIIQDKQYLEN